MQELVVMGVTLHAVLPIKMVGVVITISVISCVGMTHLTYTIVGSIAIGMGVF
jgi:hypothetical protein